MNLFGFTSGVSFLRIFGGRITPSFWAFQTGEASQRKTQDTSGA
jgi:hypothetical protein